jgi:hypothetical protein
VVDNYCAYHYFSLAARDVGCEVAGEEEAGDDVPVGPVRCEAVGTGHENGKEGSGSANRSMGGGG